MGARLLSTGIEQHTGGPLIGVFTTCDPRIDEDSRKRSQNIVRSAANIISNEIKLPSNKPVPVVYSDVLIETEEEADFASGKIAISSPIAKGLLGHKIGDEIEIEVPARVIQYKVLDIQY